MGIVTLLSIRTKPYISGAPLPITEVSDTPDTGCCESGNCPAAAVIRILGSELKLVAMHGMMSQGRRFNELRELTGICQSSLARTLRELEDVGLVERVAHLDERPIGVEYRLTRMGADLSVAIEALEDWTRRWLPTLEAQIGRTLA